MSEQVYACPNRWVRVTREQAEAIYANRGEENKCSICGDLLEGYSFSLEHFRYGGNTLVQSIDDYILCPRCLKQSVQIDWQYEDTMLVCASCGEVLGWHQFEDMMHAALQVPEAVPAIRKALGYED